MFQLILNVGAYATVQQPELWVCTDSSNVLVNSVTHAIDSSHFNFYQHDVVPVKISNLYQDFHVPAHIAFTFRNAWATLHVHEVLAIPPPL